jgi:hypothetical protein
MRAHTHTHRACSYHKNCHVHLDTEIYKYTMKLDQQTPTAEGTCILHTASIGRKLCFTNSVTQKEDWVLWTGTVMRAWWRNRPHSYCLILGNRWNCYCQNNWLPILIHDVSLHDNFIWFISVHDITIWNTDICTNRRSRNNQHYALDCTTALFNIQAPTCFGSSLPKHVAACISNKKWYNSVHSAGCLC